MAKDTDSRSPRIVRLPGFASEETIGLGDVLKRATATVGLQPCGGCRERAARLNQRVAFTARRRSL
jgi:hypothetical protein